MFNNIKVYSKFIHDEKCKICFNDYILQIDDTFYPCYDEKDPKDYDLVLSTSSLDNLESFILRLFIQKNKTDIQKKLLYFLYLFWKSYTEKLSYSISDYLKDFCSI